MIRLIKLSCKLIDIDIVSMMLATNECEVVVG